MSFSVSGAYFSIKLLIVCFDGTTSSFSGSLVSPVAELNMSGTVIARLVRVGVGLSFVSTVEAGLLPLVKSVFCGAIAPLSVLPDYQSKGIGSKLIKVAISESKKIQLDALFVLGNPKFYQKFGFKKSNLKNKYNTQNFQELEITKECLTDIDSKIHYAEAFSNLS